jgi:multidrug efflux pump subunit AcrA (membrane-fusion protein)
VQSIGLLPASTTTTTSYPVKITVPNAPAALATGSRARVSIVIGTRHNVLTVPNSAVNVTGSGSATVTVLANDATARKTVKLGAVGIATTEISSGLAVGDQVVIADRSQSLPTNATTTGRIGGGAFVGGPGGGGFGRPGG